MRRAERAGTSRPVLNRVGGPVPVTAFRADHIAHLSEKSSQATILDRENSLRLLLMDRQSVPYRRLEGAGAPQPKEEEAEALQVLEKGNAGLSRGSPEG